MSQSCGHRRGLHLNAAKSCPNLAVGSPSKPHTPIDGLPARELEPGQPNPPSEPRTSSNLNTLAWVGAAIANGGITTFLVIASLLLGNADHLDRRAEDVADQGRDSNRATRPAPGEDGGPPRRRRRETTPSR